jgi:hypothetical protein
VHDRDRFRLRLGPCRMRRCRIGGWLTCAVRGKVRVDGIRDSRISWPVTKASPRPVPVIAGGLLRAIRRESVQAVAHQWGVSAQTVTKWRRLGVPVLTAGTVKLFRAGSRIRPPWPRRRRTSG